MQQQILKNGDRIPVIGQGTWFLGEQRNQRESEMEGIRAGIENGQFLIDTAEMYGDGAAEDMIGEALSGVKRESVYLVSKVLPSHAGRGSLERALDGSLRRLRTDYLDLYLYHWRGSIPLSETVSCLEEMKKKGKIRAWGVSNFDLEDMEELWRIPGGKNCQVNQVLYHTGSRGIEYALLPWMREHGVALMSYCPLAQAGSLRRGLFENKTLKAIADAHGVPVTQILLAWNIRDGHTTAIPRSSKAEHTLSNGKAASIALTREELAAIDRAYPAPVRRMPLDVQ